MTIERLTLYTPQFGRLLVQDLWLQLQSGDALLITGPSGCGERSLLRAIAAAHSPARRDHRCQHRTEGNDQMELV